jgi:predicted nucleic acid-binding protein
MRDDFLDSNVILYSFDNRDERYEMARKLVQESVQTNATISFQVVQEVLNVLGRDMNAAQTTNIIDLAMEAVLIPMWRVMPSPHLYDRAIGLRARYRYSFYDSLIIAAALEAGCTRLYSEDLQHGQRIDRLTIVNPFA